MGMLKFLLRKRHETQHHVRLQVPTTCFLTLAAQSRRFLYELRLLPPKKKSGAKRPEPQIMPRSRSSPTTTHIRGVDEVWSRSGIDWGEGLEGELDLSFLSPGIIKLFGLQMADGVQVVLWARIHPSKVSFAIHKKTSLWHNWRLFSLGLLHLIQIPGETWQS